MEKLRAGFEFIFSSYKRTAAILFIAALTLAIPITVSLISQQQDIRQRATFEGYQTCQSDSDCQQGFFCKKYTSGFGTYYQGSCTPSTTSPTPTQGTNPTPTQGEPTTCSPKPWYCAYYTCSEPSEGWCPNGTTPTTSPTSSPTASPTISPTAPPQGTSTPSPSPTPSQGTTPTPTDNPNETRIGLAVQLTGIGSTADVARGINNNPKRPARNIEVKFFNAQNQEVLARNGGAQFDASSGLYKGTVTLGANFVGGSYIVKVRMDNTLWKTIPGIQNITAGTTFQTATTQLVTGDVNQDNEINLTDYTVFLSCLRGRCEGFQTVRLDIETLMYAFNIKMKHE